MAFDSQKFLAEYYIESWPSGAKNVPAGCIGVRCPFCGDVKNHMHFRTGTFAVKCWRCGPQKLTDTIAALLKIPINDARKILHQFNTDAALKFKEPIRRASQLHWPLGIGPLTPIHQRYLESRNYDPHELKRVWGLKGTNHKDPYYRMRIVAPVTYDRQAVSYQSRDVIGVQLPVYKACLPENEVISHKDLLYGEDLAIWDSVVIVEGITDAWRLGPGAVCTFGVKWTVAQAMMIVRHWWQRVFILYDPDEAGVTGANTLYQFLTGYNVNVELLNLTGSSDPGSMAQTDANYLMKKELKIK